MAAHPDLDSEQAYIEHAYNRLDAMRASASATLRDAFSQTAGGTFQARTERDVIVRTTLSRLDQLQIGTEPLVFGRIDRAAADGEGLAEAFHIGRLAVSDDDQEPLVVDWRAPVAEPFYRATGMEPMGLVRRRHFLTEGRRVTGIEDELFGAGAAEAAEDTRLALRMAGPGALLAALERTRSGRMRDIVATVQREQDEIIRAPLPGVLVVQGGPGTGKTAVALHRAAYLLYTYRFPLERQGVLVVGPNPLFLRYIEHVLPSLGESGVELTTVSGLVGDVKVRGADAPATAKVKSDPRMARVVARAVADRQRGLPDDLTIGFGPHRLRLSRADSAAIVATVKRRPGTHNARRRQFEGLVFRHFHTAYQAAEARIRRVGLRPVVDEETAEEEGLAPPIELTQDDVARDLKRNIEVLTALDRMWPRLTPQQLLHDLFGARPLLALAGRNALTDDEIATLYRRRSPAVEDVAWTDGDVALLDEARALLGPLRHRPAPGEEPDEIRAFGHIVVDEAQDLSPMQLRMLARRSLSGSMTVVGDIAQATGQWSPSSWDDVLAHLPTRRGTHVVELTVNYRTPSEIMEVAARVLARARIDVRPPESVRASGHEPTFVTTGHGERVGDAVVAAVRDEVERVVDGTVAVIVAPSMVTEDEVMPG
jgi:DNA helicase IV